MKTLLCTLALSATLCGPSLHAAEVIPLENPGFEKSFDAWEAYADGDKSKIISEAAHTGKLGLRVTDESESDGCMIQSTKFPCQSGKTYELKFWSRFLSGEGAAVYLKFYDAADQEVAPDTVTAVPSETTTWKEFSASIVPPAGAVKFMIWIHTGNAAKATVDFDDFRLTRLE